MMGIEESISNLVDMTRALVTRISRFDNESKMSISLELEDGTYLGRLQVVSIPRELETILIADKRYTVHTVIHVCDLCHGFVGDIRVIVSEVMS